jgi:hypothetical protein
MIRSDDRTRRTEAGVLVGLAVEADWRSVFHSEGGVRIELRGVAVEQTDPVNGVSRCEGKNSAARSAGGLVNSSRNWSALADLQKEVRKEIGM